MKYILFSALSLALLIGCGTSQQSDGNSFNDADYGYSEKNPIKVGGFDSGPANERRYLQSLSGPEGQEVFFSRIGSCCAFKTKNSPFGGGLLDKYWVTYEGKKDTVTLYLNMYDKGTLKVPVGFKMKN